MVAMDANEAIFHVLALSDEWSVDLSTLSFNVADNRLQLCDTQRSKTWNVDLTQIPSRNRETFVGKLAEAVRQVKNGQQGHPVDHDSDKEHPQWPSSPSFDRPGGHPQVPRPLVEQKRVANNCTLTNSNVVSASYSGSKFNSPTG